MNDVLPLISRLKKLDIGIELVDDKLKFNAPEGVLTTGIINELKEKKASNSNFKSAYIVFSFDSPVKL